MKHIKEGVQHAAYMTMKCRVRGLTRQDPNKRLWEFQDRLLAQNHANVDAMGAIARSLVKMSHIAESRARTGDNWSLGDK